MAKKNPHRFAPGDPATREAAGKGGKAVQARGMGHRFTSDEAATAGAKGGTEAHRRGTALRWSSAEAKAARAKSKGRLGTGKKRGTHLPASERMTYKQERGRAT